MQSTELGQIKRVPVVEILPNPYQPEGRLISDPALVKRCADSIQEHGLLQTPVARLRDGKYQIADGWLRLSAFRLLAGQGLSAYSEIPVDVRELSDRQMADMVMEANTVRHDLGPIDLAKLYKRYLEDFKISQTELGRLHGCSQAEIANTIRILDLPEEVKQKVISREISETHGRQLLRLNYNPGLQKRVLGESLKEGYSVNQLSNEVANTMYRESDNIDPEDYPRPEFDITGCKSCQYRQKIGTPYRIERKTWRCLDKACYQKKKEQAEKDRAEKLAAEIAAAKKDGDKSGESVVLDCSKLTWREYQSFNDSLHKIDKSECGKCPRRAVGKMWKGRTEMVCIDVKCFKAKEKACQDKENAKAREAEHQLTERVKAACDNLNDEATAFRLITGYLLTHSRKDTRERFARMYGIPDPGGYFASGNEVATIQRTVALVLELERYEGEKGMFKKMLADLEGTGTEIEKQIAEFRAAHCKTCRHNKGGCKTLMRVYPEGKCYAHWKKSKEDEDEERLPPVAEGIKVGDDQQLNATGAPPVPLAIGLPDEKPDIDLATLIIRVPHDEETRYRFQLGNIELAHDRLKDGLMQLLKEAGVIESQDPDDVVAQLGKYPPSNTQKLIVDIMAASKDPAKV